VRTHVSHVRLTKRNVEEAVSRKFEVVHRILSAGEKRFIYFLLTIHSLFALNLLYFLFAFNLNALFLRSL
jgi:hypothetical protein